MRAAPQRQRALKLEREPTFDDDLGLSWGRDGDYDGIPDKVDQSTDDLDDLY